MKLCIIAIVAVLGVVGLATAQYPGYQGYGLDSGSDSDSNSFGIMSIGLLFFLFIIVSQLNRPRSVPLFVSNQSTGVNVLVGG